MKWIILYPDFKDGPKNFRENRSIIMELVSDTSGLVLAWENEEVYRSQKSKDYISHLDLSSSRNACKNYEKIWPYCGEVIKNRKFMIQNLTFKILKKNHIEQIILLAAGLSPFSLEIIDSFPEVHIFELDLDFMEKKSSLIKDIFDKQVQNIHCISYDIERPELLLQSLNQAHWDSQKSTLIVVEGISYYVTKETLFKNLLFFDKNSSFIFEYMIPYNQILEDRRLIAQSLFAKLQKECNLAFVKQYSINEIKEELLKIKANLHYLYTMKDCEKERTSENKIFPTDDSGWYEICTFSI